MKCEICGKEIEKSGYLGAELCSNTECFRKWYWVQYVKQKDNPNMVRIKGHHYTIEWEGSYFKGYDGRKFTIKFNDGRIVETTNLWHQGEIPEAYKDELTDNAEFVLEEVDSDKTTNNEKKYTFNMFLR